jgi:DNA-binding transcriptional LysR family regulator
MKFRDLKYIIEIAKIGSVSGAAKKLFVGQTSLSAILKSVEKEINYDLFTRTPSGVTLTPKGEEALRIMEVMEDNYQRMCDIANLPNLQPSTCNILCYPALCPEIGPFLSMKLSEHNKHALLHMQETLSRKSITSILNGNANIAISAATNLEIGMEQAVAENNGLVFEPLFVDQFCLCVSENSRYANYTEININEIIDLDITSTSYSPQFTGSFPSYNFKKLHQHSIFDNIDCIMRTIIRCDVATIVPAFSVENSPYIKNKSIHRIKLTGFDTAINNFFIHRPADQLSKNELQSLVLIRDFFSTTSNSQS